MSARAAAYFEGPDEANQQLTPNWLATQFRDWHDRPLRDFAHHLTRVLVERSQRVAMKKSRYDQQKSLLRVPTRVYLRDQFVFRDSNEGGGRVGLRWDQLVTVLAGLGMVERGTFSKWEITERGRRAL
jgi:hypothetical protein